MGKAHDNRDNGKTLTMHPIPLEEALADALKVPPPPNKNRRGGKQPSKEKHGAQSS
jgi:hypothetical protein